MSPEEMQEAIRTVISPFIASSVKELLNLNQSRDWVEYRLLPSVTILSEIIYGLIHSAIIRDRAALVPALGQALAKAPVGVDINEELLNLDGATAVRLSTFGRAANPRSGSPISEGQHSEST